MSSYFRHTATDHIFIGDGNTVLSITLKEFLKLEPSYDICNGTIKSYFKYKFREYSPGVKHIFLTVDGKQLPGVPEWTDGDKYIKNAPKYIENFKKTKLTKLNQE